MKTITMLLFALWWGGFTFYAYWVIPVAHMVTGDKIVTGLITQKVSTIINVLCALFILSASIHSFIVKAFISITRLEKIALICLAICLVVLIILHSVMDKLLPYDTSRVEIRTTFYHYHQVYLWVSTLMWVGGLTWLISKRKSLN